MFGCKGTTNETYGSPHGPPTPAEKIVSEPSDTVGASVGMPTHRDQIGQIQT
jgi:hypothetical protein